MRLAPLWSLIFLVGCNSAEHANDLLSRPFTAHTVYAQKALSKPQDCYCYPTLADSECYATPQNLIKAAYYTDPVHVQPEKEADVSTQSSPPAETTQNNTQDTASEPSPSAEEKAKQQEEIQNGNHESG